MITLVYTGNLIDAIPDAEIEHYVSILVRDQTTTINERFSTQNVLLPIKLAIVRGELKPENIVVALNVHFEDTLESVECHFDAYGDMEPYPEIFSQQAMYARSFMIEASKKRIAARS